MPLLHRVAAGSSTVYLARIVCVGLVARPAPSDRRATPSSRRARSPRRPERGRESRCPRTRGASRSRTRWVPATNRARAWPPPARTAVRIPCRDTRARDRGSSPGTWTGRRASSRSSRRPGWPASFASACSASSRARAPRRSGEKYRCRKLSRGGCANLAWFFSNQLSEFVRRRLARGGHVLGQELHLLRHAALDDLVVLVETHRERLAVEDLLLDFVLDQAFEFLRRREAAPLRLVHQGQLGDLVERQPDLRRRRGRRASGLREGVEAEQTRAEQQEVEQRLAEEASHGARDEPGAGRDDAIAACASAVA